MASAVLGAAGLAEGARAVASKRKPRTFFIKILFRLIRWITRARFETEVPPEFYITLHAGDRIKERLNCSDEKIKKLVVKAWLSEEYTKELRKRRLSKANRAKNVQLRSFLGYVWVFKTRYIRYAGFEQKVLVTVINPRVKMDVKLHQKKTY